MTKHTLSTILLVLCLITYSCNNRNKNTNNNQTNLRDSIESITALYFNYSFINKAMYTWDMVEGKVPDFANGEHLGVLDATIDNPSVIGEIRDLMNTLQPADTNHIPDDRIAVTIRYKSGKEDHLAISHIYTDRFYLNDTLQQTNNRLLYLIKNNIGYYAWMLGDDMTKMEELADTSFVKEPFIRDKYYKLWQETKK